MTGKNKGFLGRVPQTGGTGVYKKEGMPCSKISHKLYCYFSVELFITLCCSLFKLFI